MRARLSSVPSPEPHRPLVREPHMIGDFLHRFLRDRGELRIGRVAHFAQQQFLPVGEQELPRDGLGEIAVRLLDQKAVAEIEHVAMKGERIGIAAFAFRLARNAEEMRRLPDEIEPDIGERQIDLQHRRMAAPFGQALAEDQRVVAQPERMMEQR